LFLSEIKSVNSGEHRNNYTDLLQKKKERCDVNAGGNSIDQ
jgi:hypothetical protein